MVLDQVSPVLWVRSQKSAGWLRFRLSIDPPCAAPVPQTAPGQI